jgi:RimJ/RimL family protein N-acetyltransferase
MRKTLAINETPRANETAWEVVRNDWRFALPLLSGSRVRLREVTTADLRVLLALLGREEMGRFLAPLATASGPAADFADLARHERESGRVACFAVIPAGCSEPVGLIQLRHLDSNSATADWDFAIACQFRGTGVFQEAARLVVEFAFGTVGVHRLEARAAVRNGRGNGALSKLGAVREGLLRKSFLRDGEYLDQMLWSIVREDWMQSKAVWSDRVH